MKKILRITMIFISVLVVISPGCQKDFTEINTDPNGTPSALPAQLLAPALVNTLTTNMVRNRNFNNELMQVTVNQSDAEAVVFRYEFRRNLSDYAWNNLYVQLNNFKDIYNLANSDSNIDKSYRGISLICQAWVFSILTDTYGDIPYSEALKGKELVFEPKFDQQKDVYLGLFQQLEEANTLLAGAPNILAGSDPVYQGNASRWRKFGNSLYLRLLLRLSGKAEVAQQCIDKIKDIVDVNPSNYPRIASNDESAILKWTGMGPFTSPYVLSVREQDWRAPSIGAFFIDHLRDWNDPRLDISTYGRNGVNRWGIAQGPNGFAGVKSGYVPGTGEPKQSYFYSSASVVSGFPAQNLQNDPLTGMIMNYAEQQFILAEAAAKGWINGSAEDFYKSGVLNSITLWVPTWSLSVDTYLINADMQFLPTDGLAEKMEKIHLQKYYALFLADNQQWFEYRRTGYPTLPKGPGLRNDGIMPARMTYPVYVESANPSNYKLAVAAQGPDEIFTQVWWQKP
ncbi:SusD/RagB family nutrient-binding outer membrane lipoprotein [Pedobacter puniceum]|uniref:SusD/RagB family nutrient-binding outer membrane lipoprotein n=1 Tax=Pedobacter puniceum TaxID=2666136 RepID=A0A7K0FRE7_9SPHI|nr:SusD/RagB family nutrient-binding outer membrane lipoprotein [Pedobacter puniceum]MRX48579.1 SusD/RagB family nutrient-binding outer membrane lipoprotein [Pedobacter puniceum]